MIALHLYWKNNGDDVDLGVGYHQVMPPIGGLVTHASPHGAMWRVVTHLQYLIEEGSVAWQAWRAGRTCDPASVVLFVEPAEGPFEP